MFKALINDIQEFIAFRIQRDQVRREKEIAQEERRIALEQKNKEQTDLQALLKRANMNNLLGVVPSTDGKSRLRVGSPRFSEAWGDCVGITFMDENKPGIWYGEHIFSPARARLIAHLLLDRAQYLEDHDPGMKCIDHDYPTMHTKVLSE